MLLIFAIPAAVTYTYGRMAREPETRMDDLRRYGADVFHGGISCVPFREDGNPVMHGLAVDQTSGNMEGKEGRFGVANSALLATVTTDASCGAVNSMHDSFTCIGGLVPLANIQLGEVDLRRRWSGTVRYVDLCPVVGFYRRPDGRPHS